MLVRLSNGEMLRLYPNLPDQTRWVTMELLFISFPCDPDLGTGCFASVGKILKWDVFKNGPKPVCSK